MGMIVQDKHFSYYILITDQIHCLTAFTSWDIGQYMYRNWLFPRLWRNKFWNYFKVRNFRKIKFGDFAIFCKFAKVWNREVFDLVALAKVSSRENVQFFGRESISREKYFLL